MAGRLLIKMKSGDSHLVQSPHDDMDEFLMSLAPRFAGQTNWCLYKLAEPTSSYDNVIFEASQVESAKYLGTD